ncbi:hypothetical protein HPB48_010951 [Haemaphysalis longicornis]|uniref:Peptidase M13 C-terminal domain-containing protein n=1 Tax=Haemaphysalis longicornis TaxID=44386 RepID=A0A9J6GPZ9_HAELO|nr:hypothetical protein HPB48_010951 [Haemaphysalis longicornis]
MVELSPYLPNDVERLRDVWYTQFTGMYKANVEHWRVCMHSIDRAVPLYLLYIYSDHLNKSSFKEVVVQFPAGQDAIKQYFGLVQHLRKDMVDAYTSQKARMRQWPGSVFDTDVMYDMQRQTVCYFYDTGKLFPEMVWSEVSAENFRTVVQCFEDKYSAIDDPTNPSHKLKGSNVNESLFEESAAIAPAFKDNCAKANPAYMKHQMHATNQALIKERVNLALKNSHEFSRVFQCDGNKAMNPSHKCPIWSS